MTAKRKYLEDAASLIDERIAILCDELADEERRAPKAPYLSSDRAAIAEAKHLAALIRALIDEPYRRRPYAVARGRLGYGKFIE